MMKEYFRKRPDLGLSIALHAFLFFALLFFVLLRSCSNKTPVHVFELTELSEAPSTQSQQSAPQVQAQEQAVPLPAKRMQIDDFLKEHPAARVVLSLSRYPRKPPKIPSKDLLPYQSSGLSPLRTLKISGCQTWSVRHYKITDVPFIAESVRNGISQNSIRRKIYPLKLPSPC